MKSGVASYFLAIFLLPASALARDVGYALECRDSETGLRQYVSFLEEGVDKRVNFLETASRTLWDDHTWGEDGVVVSSFMQMKSEAEARLTAKMEIDKASLSAVYRRFGDTENLSTLQCVPWSPQTRNK